ncbi:sigma-70 family RNA polymerase sigma factor [Clostridium sp. UBA6640]|uniref:sigma-70 family RNA polymerase sigma factor n=1 Tax=Clostridium sp. UBA6640 TaxID=1946370 RepID=UPI0025C2E70C|nr:sigma-70 family RNA polymerase sigma factor [Clostridium sp. UBA6640]
MDKLVKKAQGGNDKAFLRLFQTYEEELYRIAFLYVKNKEDALDVIQEAAYRSFKNLSSLKNTEYFKTWLTKITINCAIDHIRKMQKVVELNPEHVEYTEFYDEDTPLKLTLNELMDTLNENEKSIVILKYYYEYTFKEISEILELPLGTGKSILYRALGKLRKKAEEVNFYEKDN